MSENMPQESPSNEKNKSKQRFSGQRRNYVNAFRWGFVSEEENTSNVAPKSTIEKPDVKKTDTKKAKPPMPTPPASIAAATPDASIKPKQNRRRKKAVAPPTTESPAKAQVPPKVKSSEGNAVKQLAKTSADSLSKQPVPGQRPPKGRKRAKAVLPSYIAADKYDENDEDLKLPSYGRTPIPTDDELPVPQTVQKPPQSKKTAPPRWDSRPSSPDPVVSDVVPGGFRPRKEQMVWDPDKLEYVPLVAAKEPKVISSKKPPKQTVQTADSRRQTEERKPNVPSKPPKQAVQTTDGRWQTAGKEPSVPAKPPQGKKSGEHKSSDELPNKSFREPTGERLPHAHEQTASQREEQPNKQSSKQYKEKRGNVPKFVESPHPDPADIESEVSGFAELGVSEAMLEALKMVRYLEPTPIQAGVFRKVQAGVDIMGQAHTGTGKTAAFSMPIIEGVETCPPGNDPVALILVPTRELAVQVRDEAARLAYGRDIRITACYGGKPLAKQIERLRSGVDILVGTPGRILDLMRRTALSLDSLRWVVLDEADRMLDIGFRPDIEKILRRTPQNRQTLLFSATLPQPVVRLAEKYMKSPEVLDFSNKGVAVETIEQFYVTVDPERKFDALVYLLEEQQPSQAIIFTRTKRGADRVARLLAKRFDKLAAIHGDLQQSERDKVMAQFRAGSLKYLVATDVVGRGIDVSGISHIINYDVPKFCDDYVHRVGRTGRMGREGIAFTFVTVQEGSELTRIEMRIDRLLKRAELKGFESFTKPHDPNVSLEDDLPPEPSKPVFGKPIRKVRRAL